MKTFVPIVVLVTAAASSVVACVPDFDDRLARIDEPRIVGVLAEPAEAREGEEVRLRALIAAPPGATTPAPSYRFCLDRKPLTELGPVNPSCLDPSAEPSIAEPLGAGEAVTARVPADACRRFGPRRPEPQAGEAAGRPVDPDPSGGYYQPIVLWLGPSELTLGALRLDCGLSGVSRDAQLAFRERYRPNQNPTPSSFAGLRGDGARLELESSAAPLDVGAGEVLTLELTWPPCAGDAPCAGAETYAFYDADSGSVVDRREALTVSWYASGGALSSAHAAISASAPDVAPSTVTFSAPDEPGEVAIFAVLRDDRGGVSLSEGRLRVR